jgi:hypothetical protein
MVGVEYEGVEAENGPASCVLPLLFLLVGGPVTGVSEPAAVAGRSPALGCQAEAGGGQQLQLVQLNADKTLQNAVHVVDAHGHLGIRLVIIFIT